ncbi:hypothetical protein FM102_03850 [Corynebacterium glutamicum]|nr:hypothetical protein FM102_03850 [Corynebacterium glutamicum]
MATHALGYTLNFPPLLEYLTPSRKERRGASVCPAVRNTTSWP